MDGALIVAQQPRPSAASARAPKRTRTQAGARPANPKRKRAAAIGAYYNRKYPYADWGTQRHQKGTMVAQAGQTWRSATPEQRAWRRANNYYGVGGYWGRTIGGALGKAFKAPWMAAVGDKAGDFIVDELPKLLGGKGMYTGSGMYNPTSANSLVVGPHNDFQVPQFSPATDGSSVVISHKEYIGDFYAPPVGVGFTNQTYKINPGLEATFPWLAQVAQNYVEYRIDQLIFTYKSTVADFAASSGQVGQIIGVTQYDANQKPFTEKRSMMEYDAAQSCKTSSNLLMGVECDPRKNAGAPTKFVRTTPLATAKDLNQYDHGTFNIACHDTPDTYANQVLGEIWVSYTVELRKPKVFTGKAFGIQKDIYCSSGWNGSTGTSSNVGLPNLPAADLSIFGEAPLHGERNSLNTRLKRHEDRVPIAATPLGITYLAHPTKVACLDGQHTDTGIFSQPGNWKDYEFVIPATYTGNLKVTFAYSLNSQTSVPNIVIMGAGNLTPIQDFAFPQSRLGAPTMTDTTASGIIAMGSNGSGGAALFPESALIVCHVRVEQATGGLDNAIHIMCDCTDVYGYGTFITIEEYNTIQSYEQDGTNDQPVLVNDMGTRVQPYSS